MANKLPAWLAQLRDAGDWPGVRWHSLEQITDALKNPEPFNPDGGVPLTDDQRDAQEQVWARMVSVADGPQHADRTGRAEQVRLWVDRASTAQLFVSLADAYLPAWWIPAGRTRASVESALARYILAQTPPQTSLPFQGRLFLDTMGGLGDDFTGVENRVIRCPFTDMLPWGSAQGTDPYPEKVTLGRIPPAQLREFMSQRPDSLPYTCIRTRHSRSIIRLIDCHGGFFADLFFASAPHEELVAAHNELFGTSFPPTTPVDVIATLNGWFACMDAATIRLLAEGTDGAQRETLDQIVAFLEQATE